MPDSPPQDTGASVPDQALAVPVEPVARLDPTGFDPSRGEISLSDARDSLSAVSGYAVLKEAMRAPKDSAGWPRLSPGEARNIKFAMLDAYEAIKHTSIWLKAVAELSEAPGADPSALMELVGKGARSLLGHAIATEARRAATGNTDAVHEGAGPKGHRHD